MNTLFGLGVIALGTYLGTSKRDTETTREKIHKLRKESLAKELKTEESLCTKYAGRNKSAMYYVQQKRGTREKRVRNILETMFHERFPNVRPKWLVNPKTGRKLEIDCYCEPLRLGVEIQGEQHYRYIPHYHKKGYDDFVAMKERDLMKRACIRNRGIDLISIPYTVKENDLEAYILEQVYKVRNR
jgi:hypothetical protein